MPLYAGELNLRRGAPLAEFPAPMSEVLRSQAEETQARNPMESLRRLNALSEAGRGELLDFGDIESGRPAEYAPAQRLDAATARQRVKDEGLPLTIPDEGISRGALDILIRRKREELQRQDVMSRGPGGIGPGAARLGVALYESLFDPLNIASAFIPVVGPSRYAALVAGAGSALGRAGVRAGVGALEGAAGAALLEPLIYSAARAEQADYDMMDSLANIAFGGLFGGGLHAGGGAVRDFLQPGWWRAAQPTLTSSRVDADAPLVRALEGAPEVPASPLRAPGAVDALDAAQRIADVEVKPGFLRTAEDLLALRGERTPEIERATEILKQPAFERAAEDRVFLAALGKGHEADYINDRVGQMLRQLDEIDQRFLMRGNSPQSEAAVALKAPIAAELQRAERRLVELGRPVTEARLVMERTAPETKQAALRASVAQAVEGRQTEVEAVVRADPAVRPRSETARNAVTEARGAAVRNASPEAIRAADSRASAIADETAKVRMPADLQRAEAELADTLTAAQDFAQALGDGERVKADLADFDKAIQRAEAYGKALRAGAACGIA